MATIKINDTQFEATLAQTGERLTLTLTDTALPLDELAALFDPGSAAEVRVLGGDGMTSAIYSNRRVVEVGAQLDAGSVRSAFVALQIEPIEQGEADRLREQIKMQAATISRLQTDSASKDAQIAAQQSTLDHQAATIADQQQAEALLKAQIQAVSDRGDFVEDCLAEMATVVYP